MRAPDGVIGARPNASFAVDPEKLPVFADAVARLADESGLARRTDRFGIRHGEPRFRPPSAAPGEAAVPDVSRLANR